MQGTHFRVTLTRRSGIQSWTGSSVHHLSGFGVTLKGCDAGCFSFNETSPLLYYFSCLPMMPISNRSNSELSGAGAGVTFASNNTIVFSFSRPVTFDGWWIQKLAKDGLNLNIVNIKDVHFDDEKARIFVEVFDNSTSVEGQWIGLGSSNTCRRWDGGWSDCSIWQQILTVATISNPQLGLNFRVNRSKFLF